MVDISENSISATFKNLHDSSFLFAGQYCHVDIAFDITGNISNNSEIVIDISSTSLKLFEDPSKVDFSSNLTNNTYFTDSDPSFSDVSWNLNTEELVFTVSGERFGTSGSRSKTIKLPQVQFLVNKNINMNETITAKPTIIINKINQADESTNLKTLSEKSAYNPINDISLTFHKIDDPNSDPYANDDKLTVKIGVEYHDNFFLTSRDQLFIDFQTKDSSNNDVVPFKFSNNISTEIEPTNVSVDVSANYSGNSNNIHSKLLELTYTTTTEPSKYAPHVMTFNIDISNHKYMEFTTPSVQFSYLNENTQTGEKTSYSNIGKNPTPDTIYYDPTKVFTVNQNSLKTSKNLIWLNNELTLDFSLNAELSKNDIIEIDISNGKMFQSNPTLNPSTPGKAFDISYDDTNGQLILKKKTDTTYDGSFNIKSGQPPPYNISFNIDISNGKTPTTLNNITYKANQITTIKSNEQALTQTQIQPTINLEKPYFGVLTKESSGVSINNPTVVTIDISSNEVLSKILDVSSFDISTNLNLQKGDKVKLIVEEILTGILDGSFIKNLSGHAQVYTTDTSSNSQIIKDNNIYLFDVSLASIIKFDVSKVYITTSDLSSTALENVQNIVYPHINVHFALDLCGNGDNRAIMHGDASNIYKPNNFYSVNTQSYKIKMKPKEFDYNRIQNLNKDQEQIIQKNKQDIMKLLHSGSQNTDTDTIHKITKYLNNPTINNKNDISTNLSTDLKNAINNITSAQANIKKNEILNAGFTQSSDTLSITTIEADMANKFFDNLSTSQQLDFTNITDNTVKEKIKSQLAESFQFEFRSDISGYQNSAGVFSLSGDIEKLFSSDINENIKESNKLIEARIKKMRDTGGDNFKYVVNSIEQAPINIEEQFAHYKEVINASTTSKPKFQIFDSKSTGTGTGISANDFFRNNMKKVKTGASGEFIIPMIALDTSGDQITIDFNNSKMLKQRPGKSLNITYKNDVSKLVEFKIISITDDLSLNHFSTNGVTRGKGTTTIDTGHQDGGGNTQTVLYDITYDLSVNNSIEIFGYRMKVTNPNPYASLIYIVNDKCETRFEIEDLDKLKKYWGDHVTDASARAIELSLNSIKIKETTSNIKTLDPSSLQILKSLIQKSGNFDNNSDSRRSLAILDIMENKPGIDKLEINGNDLSGIIVDPRSIESTDISYIISKSIIKNIKDGNYTQVWTGISNEITGASMNVYIPMKIDEELPIKIKDISNVIHDSGIKYIKKYNNGRYEHTLENAIINNSNPESELDYIELEFKEEVEVALNSSIKKKNIKIKNLNKLNIIPNTRIYKDGNNLVIFKGDTYNDIIFGNSDMYYATNRVEIKSQKPSIDLDNNKIVEYTFKLKNGLSIKMNFGSIIITDPGKGTVSTGSDTTETPRIFMSTPLSEKYYSVKNRHYKMQFTSRAFNSATQLYKTSNNMIINQQLSTKGSSNRLRKLKAKAIAQNKYSKQ